MSKAEVIEIEGTVVEKTSECHVSGRTGKWTSGTCTYQRKVAYELYQNFTG